MNKIIAVYKITNTITGDFYIGSSKDVKKRWRYHKKPSTWKRYPNSQLYQDIQKYSVDKFEFEIITEVESDKLKEIEQKFIEMLNPTYNNRRAKGWDIGRYKESEKEYYKSEKGKESNRKAQKKYRQSEKGKESNRKAQKKYRQSDKGKEYHRKAQKKYRQSDKGKEYQKKYNNQLCYYNGETLTLAALSTRFRRAGIPHSVIEAKKYLIGGNND